MTDTETDDGLLDGDGATVLGRARAALAVAGSSLGPADCAEMLDALGLLDALRADRGLAVRDARHPAAV